MFAAVNGFGDWLYRPVWAVMQLGTVGLAAVTGLVVGYVLRRPTLALVFALTPIVAWWAAKILKDLVERGRPAAEGLTVTIRGVAADGYGFPSGHSAVAFALATVITPHLSGRWRILPYALATIVALGRLYVGAHLPLDVVGGAALASWSVRRRGPSRSSRSTAAPPRAEAVVGRGTYGAKNPTTSATTWTVPWSL